MPEIIYLVGGRPDVEPEPGDSRICLGPYVLLPLSTLSLMVNVIPQQVPSGLSLDVPEGAGLAEEECGCGRQGPCQPQEWRTFQSRILEVEIVYKIFACASRYPHVTCVHSNSVSPLA